MKFVETDQLPTAGTDGYHCYYNPKFIEGLQTVQYTMTVLAHEVMHPALMHNTRMGNRDPEKWNAACDYAINWLLKRSGFLLPPDALINEKFANMAAEEIYEAMDDEDMPQQGSRWNIGIVMEPGSGSQAQEDRKNKGKIGELTDGELQQIEKEWNMNVRQAQTITKAIGKLPAHLEQAIGELLEPKINWADKLKPFFTKLHPTSHTWTKPNRRYIHNDIYLPSIAQGNTGEVIVAIDTSGSVSPQEFDEFASEIICMLYNARPEKIKVMYVDAEIHDIREFTPNEPLDIEKLARNGWGGTSFIPPFTYCEEHGLQPHVLVYLTDGYGPFPAEPPNFETVWVINNHEVTPPWGHHLVLE